VYVVPVAIEVPPAGCVYQFNVPEPDAFNVTLAGLQVEVPVAVGDAGVLITI
jgi:hypothetical protein